MEEVHDFEILVCGECSTNMFDYGEIITNLSSKITKITELIINYDWNNGKANIDIPFYGRNILESSLTAILGRIDPFRLILVYKVQADSSYDLGKKAQSAVEWTGDILAKEAPRNNLWFFDKKKESFDRALLGNYVGEIIWKPAFRVLSDYIADHEYDSVWLTEILSENENSNFERAKSTAARVFSSFSKGVHSECLIDINTILDDVTLKSLIKDMYKLCATLALASHFVDFLASRIDKDRALSIFLEVEEMIGNV